MNFLIKKPDGSIIRTNCKKEQTGEYTVNTNHYGPDGYYQAGESSENKSISFDTIERAINFCKDSGFLVTQY